LDAAASVNHWANPALYVAIIALVISGGQAIRSIAVEARQRKSIQFIEVITVEFAKSEAALDLLEARLRKALNNTDVTSAMTSVSEMPAVAVDLFSATNVDELDAIMIMADEQVFESGTRKLHIQTAMNILTRVTANMASAKRDLTHTHL
jgi:hypothetical protein